MKTTALYLDRVFAYTVVGICQNSENMYLKPVYYTVCVFQLKRKQAVNNEL